MKKIIILGAGYIGSAIAVDLAKQFKVTVVDRDPHKLNYLRETHSINTIISDVSSEIKIQEIIIDYDLVINALPGFLGFQTLHSVIAEGKNIVDISFQAEDPFELDDLAKERNVTAVVDCGISPGLSNIILGYHNQKMEIKSYYCLVGGLPFKKKWPFNYKAFFSPIDVIEEYIRPARLVENGKIILREALSEVELIEFEEVGKLEAFNTDGLRTLLKTMKIPNMKEKTLRYPGHVELMRVFRETGFFSSKEIEVGNKKIRPIELTVKLLFNYWKPGENEEEFTLLQLKIEGAENGKEKKYEYHLFDKLDKKTGTSSMARTTGYTCSAVASLILNDDFNREGICPPEFIGADEKCYEKVIKYLKERNIKINKTETTV